MQFSLRRANLSRRADDDLGISRVQHAVISAAVRRVVSDVVFYRFYPVKARAYRVFRQAYERVIKRKFIAREDPYRYARKVADDGANLS